jgi:hypothetical protein
MPAKYVVLCTVPLLWPSADAQSVRRDQLRFMGREVTTTKPELDPEGSFPKGPASVCLEGPPQRQCYTEPEDFGKDPSVSVVRVEKGMPALFFTAASGGTSGFRVHFALLRPGKGNDLQDLFMDDMSVSDQSRHAFWREPAVPDAPIFVTADALGPDEGPTANIDTWFWPTSASL